MFDKMLNENIAESRTVAANRAGGQQVPPAQGRSESRTVAANRAGGQQVPPAQGRSGKKTYGKI